MAITVNIYILMKSVDNCILLIVKTQNCLYVFQDSGETLLHFQF